MAMRMVNDSIGRGRALRLLGAISGGVLLARRAAGEASAATASTQASSPATCAVTPEGEIGPFFADDAAAGFRRGTILSNLDGTGVQTGVPLTLSVTVRDAKNACAAVAGSQVDIWHCNAHGVYSDEPSENTTGQTWLRGYQITDANGRVTFKTIVPGWYHGRTTHIHLRVRSAYSETSSGSDGTNTTQVFFPQSLIDRLSASVAPYSSQGANSTTNASDHVYATETRRATLLSLTGSPASGFAAAFTVVLPITNG
jgi:protocatechuate 3,4-dioxygenase beta subunit